MLRPTHLGFAMIGLCALALAGCTPAKKLIEVTGTVKYQGKSVDGGTIRFEPTDRNIATEGASIENGTYRIKVPLGEAKVWIAGSQIVGEEKMYNTPDSPMKKKYKPLVPLKFDRDTPQMAEIKADTTHLDFDIK